MKRITKKTDTKEGTTIGMPKAIKAYWKLKEYEDIQDELGIDLIIYHKLMEMLYCGEPNVLFVKDNEKVIRVGILEIDYCKKKIMFYKDRHYNDDYVFGFNSYGEAWALTKEELE